MNDFVCSCLYIDGNVIDRITDDFDIDIEEDDILDCLESKNKDSLKRVGIEFLYMVMEKIKNKYPQLDESKFDCDFSSPSYPDFYYGGVRFETKKELDAIAKEYA